MSKVIIKGVNKETGRIEAEIKRSAVLITELIYDFPKLCQADIHKRLCEIRESVESDEGRLRMYAQILRKKKPEEK